MKRIFSTVILIGIVLIGYSQSLLWKVTGKDLKSPSYLYGTIHIQDARVFAFDSTIVLGALESCDAFAMEILMDEINAKEMQAGLYMPKGKVLSKMMSEEDFALLDSICKKKLGASAIFMNRMKPFFLSSAISQEAIAKDQAEALDLYFLKKARASQKHCYGVEKYQVQIDAIDAISMKDQLKMLVDQLHQIQHPDTTEAEGTDEFSELLDAYLTFNMDKMLQASNDPSLPKKFNKVFLVDRNVGMANNFVKIAKEYSLFCAVGAAHLCGDKGVVTLLRKKGYTVEPVMFEWGK